MKEGWETKTLADVCHFANGLWKGEKPPFATVGVIRNTNFTKDGHLDDTDIAYIDIEARKLEKRRLEFGDIILEKSGGGPKQPVGRVALFDKSDGIFSFSNFTAAMRVRDAEELDFRFLHKFLHWKYLSGVTEGIQSHSTGIRNLNGDAYKAIEISYPPLPEQQRIVALLDEAFAGLATAKANAERNLQNARAVYESHVESIFSTRGEDWEEKRLEEVCGFQNGFAFKSSTFKPQGYPILRISNIQDGRIDAANRIVFFDPNDYREDLDRYRVSKGDLLIAMSGATTGKLGFNVEEKVYYLNQRVGKLEPTKRLDPRFLYYFLSTRVEENLRISAGSAQPNLSTEQIKGFLLPLPSIDEQTRIVDVLEALSKETQHLTQIYERKLAALEELKQSLLQQAFNGEL